MRRSMGALYTIPTLQKNKKADSKKSTIGGGVKYVQKWCLIHKPNKDNKAGGTNQHINTLPNSQNPMQVLHKGPVNSYNYCQDLHLILMSYVFIEALT